MQSTIEKISSEALLHTQGELGNLIGGDLELILQAASLIKKDGYLELLSGRNSIIGLTMSGVYEGEGCLVTAEKSVVRLGGKMLMLPPSELNEIISSANYNDEEELLYAFDEIAKCLVVSFLHPFQNDDTSISTITCQKQKIADGRKEMDEILNHLSAEPTYYHVSATIYLAGVPVNGFSLLLPAFVLVCSEPFQKDGQQTVQSTKEFEEQNIEPISLFASQWSKLLEDEVVTPGESCSTLFSHLLPALQTELGTLLGASVKIVEKGTGVAAPAELFQLVDSVPHLRTSLSISGSAPGEGWLLAEMTDANRLGLLLTEGAHGGLSPNSLSGPFSADCQDGYNEICAIFIDVLSFVCQELSEDEMILEKTVSIASGEESPESYYQDSSSNSSYRLSSLELSVEGIDSGRLHLLLPTSMHDSLRAEESITAAKAITDLESDSTASEMSGAGANYPGSSRVLTIGAGEGDAAGILKSVEAGGIAGDYISLAEELDKTNLESYQAILMVVEKLDEIALGVVIKIKSISSIPLLVVASQWTQTDVMKALRYGVDDIVMLPVDSEEILQKIRGLEPLSV